MMSSYCVKMGLMRMLDEVEVCVHVDFYSLWGSINSGHAERALELMIARASSRVAFGKLLGEQGTVQRDVAQSRIEIEQVSNCLFGLAHPTQHTIVGPPLRWLVGGPLKHNVFCTLLTDFCIKIPNCFSRFRVSAIRSCFSTRLVGSEYILIFNLNYQSW